MRLVRQASRQLGGVLASAVNFFNPGAAVMVIEAGLAPDAIDQAIAAAAS
jgi:hypothetical protein